MEGKTTYETPPVFPRRCRCANCFDCPCCMHTLSTRATNIPAPMPDDPTKTTMKKAYYLACGFCRWTSRDVGMADKSVGESHTGMTRCTLLLHIVISLYTVPPTVTSRYRSLRRRHGCVQGRTWGRTQNLSPTITLSWDSGPYLRLNFYHDVHNK